MKNMFYGAGALIFARAEALRKNPTAAEKLLWLYLKRNQLGVRFKRQHPIWMYIADFYCHELKLVIEVDGSIHAVKEIMERDKIRQDEISSLGIKIIRFTNQEIKMNITEVVNRIVAAIKQIKNNQENNEKSN